MVGMLSKERERYIKISPYRNTLSCMLESALKIKKMRRVFFKE